MFLILKKEVFAPDTFLWEVAAPEIADAAEAGQFAMVRLKEGGERIPLTIADFDRERGTVTLVVKVVGRSTEEMATYSAGERFLDFIGPLGAPTQVKGKNHIVLVGGGLGVAPLYPILRSFKELGSGTTTILGFRTRNQIFWEERFRLLSNQLLVMTEDGSYGRHGTTIDALRFILSGEVPVDEVMTVGPIGMMQAVAEVTRPLKIPTFASMNSIMVDGIGMCGSCRITVEGKVLFACVDGPDMDAHKVDFEELKVRQNRFKKEEIASLKKYRGECALKKEGRIF
ncbi:MAG: sulfide/dihydroorotate dehydrogenase-like FAD/NAD-binding protein [Deltaproteobacteria bacterium]|nr:sulfide/dihydroorotate dehydrogenase-like FAD/NAD-binding protein [Deltaproteobacteria bacterium]